MVSGWIFQAMVSRFPRSGISSRVFAFENNPGIATRRVGSKQAPAALPRFESNFLRVKPRVLLMTATSRILRARSFARLTFLFFLLPVIGGGAMLAQKMFVP